MFGFTNQDLIEFFHIHGLGMITEENGKVFPETRRSDDVLALLVKECKERGVYLRFGEPATVVTRTLEGFSIRTPKITYRSPVPVIATGGLSYPMTGSSVDGYRFFASLGQPITEIAPTLTPLLIRDYPFAALSGISFERLPFSVWRAGKKVADYQGDILFTHRGLSGPGILDASRDIYPSDVIKFSFVGDRNREEFGADLLQREEKTGTYTSARY